MRSGMKWNGAIALGLFLFAGFAQTVSAQNAPAQNPFTYGNTYQVPGDVVVAGAQGMTSRLIGGVATGTITIPDPNPGITGTKRVPDGAQIVAALLYWQTVEKVGVIPGQPGSGENGFFRPVFQGGPPTGYPITGVSLQNQTTVSFSNGGCAGSSTGKVLRTYRADVRRLLPLDANGNVVINNDNNNPAFKNLTFEVKLPSVGSNTPLTLGVSMVIIFRVLNSPNFPLNSIVIYDGDVAPGNASLSVTQTVQGFYQAAHNPVSRVIQIAAQGKMNKFQKIFLNGKELPSLYGSGQPPFVGFYGGSWDNPAWTFDPNQTYVKLPNPILEDSASATIQVIPNQTNQGCVSWGAMIVSTTVKNTDNDGLLDVWKTNQGYCDASINEGSCTKGNSSSGWVDLTGAATPGQGTRDIFVHIDYMCSLVNNDGSCNPANSFYPSQGALKMVQDAFSRHSINVHFIKGSAIQEQTCTDTAAKLCPYPGQPGIIAWKGGFDSLINQPLNYPDEISCEQALNGPCIRRVQHGANISEREAIFARALALPEWSFQGGSLTSAVASGNIVTFTTSTPHGLVAQNRVDGAGRVTVTNGITNRGLNGTYLVQSVSPDGKSFTIQIATAMNATLTPSTDPQLSIASGRAHTGSGIGDVGGAHLVVSLGLWKIPADQIDRVQGGTLMHEMGHLVGLEHGPWNYDTPGSYVPTIGSNCNTNYQSVMSYLFQVDGLDTGVPQAPTVLDYSEQQLSAINESDPLTYDLTGSPLAYPITKWYTPSKLFGIGSKATHHCDGPPLSPADPTMYRVEGTASLLKALGTSVDLNFDGKIDNTSTRMRGGKDWDQIDLLQTGATVGDTLGGGGSFGDGPGAFGDGPGAFGDGPGAFGDGPGAFGDGPGAFGDGPGAASGEELDLETANSVTRPPRNLMITMEDASPRFVHLNWDAPTFGVIVKYKVYRSENGGAFALIATLSGNPPATMFTDTTVPCDPGGFSYFVTAVIDITQPDSTITEQESVASNVVSTIPPSQDPVTGCYTFPGFSSPAPGSSAVMGSVVPFTWQVKDDFYNKGALVNNTTANTLVAIGPISNDVVCVGSGDANTPHTKIAQSGAGIGVSPGPNFQFTFNWHTSGGFQGVPLQAFPPGCYRVELDLDSGQPTLGGLPASAFQVQIYLSDVSLQVTTTSVPDGVVGSAYNQTLTETGGTTGGGQPFTWTVISGALPPGITLSVAPDAVSGLLSGTPTAPGSYTFTVKVTDSIGDFGTQTITLLVNDVVTTAADSGPGSLRQVILDVNGAPSGPRPIGILFNIPGAGVQTITPATPLPPLTQPTILDGATQPGYIGTPIIELNGSGAGASNGIHITGGGSTVRGLVIHSFTGNGILIDTSGGDVIQGNYIGTDKTGATAAPNTGNGIQMIAVPNNVVGVPKNGVPAISMRNIISGNTGEGVRIDGTLATGNVVRGNYIGTDVSGSNAVGNNASGVYIRRAPGNSVIGNTVSGNVGFAGITICGHQLPVPGFCGGGDPAGIDVSSNATGNLVQGNVVGTNAAGTAALGNSQAGVSIDGAPNTLVGGAAAGTPNTISFNGTNDVQIFSTGANLNMIQGNTIHGTGVNDVGISVGVDASNVLLTGNTLTGNSISGHAGLGIDLAPAGVNANTAGGANNYPVISSAQVASGTISGTLNGPANAKFTIEFFSNAVCNASGNGEGAVLLGSTSVTTDGTGNVAFAVSVAGLAAGNTITATSTDASGTTSEFSKCVPVS